MSALDVATIAVLAFVGVRIAGGTRIALTGKGRSRVGLIVRGLRLHHFLLALPAFVLTASAVIVLVQFPILSWGWWTALGGFGNPVTGGTERTTGTPLEWLVPLVFVLLLIPALPLFAEAEERMFRLGAEGRSRWGRLRRSVEFGLAHAIIGIPIGAALGLSVGGAYFTWSYMRVFRRTGDENASMLESTRAHTAYNATVIALVAAILIFGLDLMVIVAVILGILLVVVLASLLSFNRFVLQRQLVDNSWSNVDTELKRRYDLIPNLVETVKGYAAHERSTLEAVVKARTDAVDAQDGAAEQATQENVLVDALKQLLALREAYPDLKANIEFLDLQRQLTVTEDRIQAARRFYNANVRDYNTRVETFPSMVIAALGRFEKRDYFEVGPAIRDAGAPEVELS